MTSGQGSLLNTITFTLRRDPPSEACRVRAGNRAGEY